MLDAIYSRRDPLSAAPIRVAVVVSVFVHATLILELPQTRPPLPDLPDRGETEKRLTVRLAPPFMAPPATPLTPSPAPRLRPPPPVVALEQSAPGVTSPPIAPPATAPSPPVTVGDLSSYIEARRGARAATAAPPDGAADAPPAESDNARASRLAAANLAPPSTLTFGYDPAKSGGVFQINHVAYDYAEFTFVGWNNDARRSTKQLIEVRKGGSGDIRLAVVRRMIAIIRQYEPETFLWSSQRLGRSLTLSSRQRDNAGLEDFMMREFFEENR